MIFLFIYILILTEFYGIFYFDRIYMAFKTYTSTNEIKHTIK